jgi:serine/threonine-protein kinase
MLLALLGAGAWAGWTYLVPHYVTVPRVEGLTSAQAQARLERAGLDVETADAVFSSEVEAGLIVRTIPPSGTRIRTTGTVVLVPSKGPQLVAIPSVIGLSQQAARERLRRAGFKVDVRRVFDDEVEEGKVIDQSPAADIELEKGQTVTITVSRGPELVPIPAVAGQEAETATATLQNLGFEVITSEEFSTEVPEGDVIRTEPPAGQSLPKGSEVTLVVSKGPETFPLPNVIGMAAGAARDRLEGLGLRVREVQVPGSIGNEVVGQEPDAGTTVEQGEQVTIFVGG